MTVQVSQRPRQLCPTNNAYSWRIQLLRNSSLDLQKMFYPPKSGQTPDQMFRKVRVFTVEDAQIPPCAQWRFYPCSQCSQASKSLVTLQHRPDKYPKWGERLHEWTDVRMSVPTKSSLTKWESRQERPNLHHLLKLVFLHVQTHLFS